jgi:predicted DCC family thiol-disulfide oxidoreductase YuxK
MTRPVLLYDADCRLCRFAARLVARLDRRRELGFLPLGDPAAAPLLERLPETERFSSWRLAQPDGSLPGFGAGVADLLRAMRYTRPLGLLLAVIPDRALDSVYDVVARHRGRIGRVVPDGPGPRRRTLAANE